MISYKELRIDNWVTAPRIGNCQVYGIELRSDGEEFAWVFTNGMMAKHQVNLKQLEPIALTPEILKHSGLGFKGDGVVKVACKFDGLEIFISKIKSYVIPGKAIEITSLHQLQNTYFLIYGEELQVSFRVKTVS